MPGGTGGAGDPDGGAREHPETENRPANEAGRVRRSRVPGQGTGGRTPDTRAKPWSHGGPWATRRVRRTVVGAMVLRTTFVTGSSSTTGRWGGPRRMETFYTTDPISPRPCDR